MFLYVTDWRRLTSEKRVSTQSGGSVAQRVTRAFGRKTGIMRSMGSRSKSPSSAGRHSSAVKGMSRSEMLASTGLNILKAGVRNPVSYVLTPTSHVTC